MSYTNFQFRFAPASISLTAHRTGDLQGQAVPPYLKNRHYAPDYVVLVDDYHTQADGTPALASDTADIPDAATGEGDDDLARITLGRLPAGVVHGKYKIVLSDPSAVRLFKPDGTLFYQYGKTGDGVLTLDLSNPSGYLAELLSGDLDVWLEGVHGTPDFDFAIVYEHDPGAIITHDDVHMAIADWTFQNNLGQVVDSVRPLWEQGLLDDLQPGSTFTTAPLGLDPVDYLYKNVISGLPNDVPAQLLTTSADQSASYTDKIIGNSSSAFQGLYSNQDDYGVNSLPPLTADQQAALLSLGINVLPGPMASSTLMIGDNDKTTRQIAVAGLVPFTLNSADGVYTEGQMITATFTGEAPVPPLSPYWFSVTVTLTDGKTNSTYYATFDSSNQAVVSFQAVSMFSGTTRTRVPKYFTLSAKTTQFAPANGDTYSYLASGTVTLAVLPPDQTFSTYQHSAWNALKNQKAGNYVTGDIRQRNVQITTLYVEMFNSNQSAFEWAGIAAFASYSAGVAMRLADEWRPGAWQLGTGVYNWGAGWIDWAGWHTTPAPDADELFKFFGEGNIAIFMDMYPQMLAYQAGLLADIQNPKPLQFLTDTLPQGGTLPANMQLVSPKQLAAWQKITDGVASDDAKKIWDGNTALVEVEQSVTLQAILMLDKSLWDQAIHWNPIKSPIPGDDSTFREFAGGASFFNAAWRVKWFTDDMAPAWKKWRLIHPDIDVQKLLRGEYKKLD